MYIAEAGIEDKTRMTALPPFGPGFSKAQADKASTMDIALSSFKDHGDDFAVYILKDSEGKVIKQLTIAGY
jgi:hypothetical protein